ncbi:TolC family outer membrane protein [Massilia sp. W12]|uniref:TolC family outer membrane protein n=1 Tax=Massilia sp. W12 TaxID=3126507 RepID=UPI0030CD725D
MRKTYLALLAAGALGCSPAYAADLMQVYKQALSNDAQYASARAAQIAGQEKVVQGRSLVLPTVGLSGNVTRSDTDFLASTGTVNRSSTSREIKIALSQPLYEPARWEQYEQAKLAGALSEVQFAQAKQELILRVAQAYFDVLTAQDTLEAVKAQKTATAEQLASAKRNFEVGTQTITDTHEAQARYDLIMAQEFAAQADLDIKRTALLQITGQDPGALAPLRANVSISAPQPAKVEDWVLAAEKQNTGVQSADIAYNIAKSEIKRSRAGHMPTVDLFAWHSRGRGGLSGDNNNNTIGVQWSVPLFAGHAITSKVRESIAQEDKARNDLESAKRAASFGARQAFLGVSSGLAQVKALEAAELSSKSALDSNKLGYQVGVRINIDVLNAQQQVYSTRKDLSRARNDTLVNGLRLKSAAGTLKEEDLAQINALLQN